MPILTWVALCLAATTATAQVPAVQQEIVVTAARDEQPRDQASAAVTVLDREAVERLPADSLAEVLSFVPGLTMMFDGGASGLPMITSRGFFGGGEVEYVKLLVDGVPAGDAESGNVDWQRFRLANVDRIEVLHGPGSALYGDTALGGVVQLFTSPDAETSGTLHAAGGSFGARDFDASYRAPLAGGFRLGAEGGTWRTGGFREHAEAEGRQGRLMLDRASERALCRFDVGAEAQERQQPGALTRAEAAEDREQSNALFRFDLQTTTRGRIGAACDSFGAMPMRATLYGVRRSDDNLRTLLLAPGFGTSAARALTTTTGGGTFEISRQTALGLVRAGTDLERAALDARYDAVAFEDGHRDRVGLFLTAARSVGNRFHFSAGVRRDEIRDDVTSTTTGGVRRKETSSAWSPRAGVNVHLGHGPTPVSLFVQVSSAFKAPTIDQLFDARPYPDGNGGTFFISNADLRPQRAQNFEAGLSRTTPWSDWSVVGYRMNVRDEIDFDPQTFRYRNIGTSLHRGVELSAAVAKTARISPRVTYAWTRVADGETPDVQLKNIPEHTAQLLLHARVSERTTADVVYRRRSGLTLDDAGAFALPALSRVDLRVAHDFGRVRVGADVLNALDERYNELGYVLLDFTGTPTALEYPAPGRAVRLSVRWRFAGR
ncbi:MAG TPA: TonB-dependent receptor [Thermoanaerobaculia bacterium]